MSHTNRQLAAIMFTDIVGYTALMGRDESRALSVLKSNRSIHKRSIKKYEGKWLKEMGDGTLASFRTISDAVYCAGELIKASKENGIELRIGIHFGEVTEENGDIFGDGVNVASRLEPLAKPNQILVSGSIHRNVKNKPGIASEFLEEKQLKNVDDPVRIYSIEIDQNEFENNSELGKPHLDKTKMIKLIFALFTMLVLVTIIVFSFNPFGGSKNPSTDLPIQRSIAVLPFKDLSPEQNQEWFGDGLAEEIINSLAQIPNVKVVSRTSSFQYRNETDIKTIGRVLGVKNILEGSFRISDGRIKISVNLIQVSDGYYAWAKSYDQEYKNIISVQESISRSIVETFNVDPSDKSTIYIPHTTSNISAYKFFLLGRFYWNKRNEDSMSKAIYNFTEAIKEDSLYAQAYSGLADIYNSMGFWGYIPRSVAYENALKYTNKALEINEDLGQAYGSLGYLQYAFEWDWKKGGESLQKSCQLNPNYASAYAWHAIGYRLAGDSAKAMNEIKTALTLDPISLIINFGLSLHYFYDGDLDLSISQLSKVIEMDQDLNQAHYLLYQIYFLKGEHDAAFDHFVRWRVSFKEDSVSLKKIYNTGGWNEVAKQVIRLSNDTKKFPKMTPLDLARYYFHLNDRKSAIKYLEEAYEQKIPLLPLEGLSPFWASLYDEEEFVDLMRKMNLPIQTLIDKEMFVKLKSSIKENAKSKVEKAKPGNLI